MIVKRYEIEFKTRVTKVQKMAHVIARTKVEAKRVLASREASPIIQWIGEIAEIDVPDGRFGGGYVEKTEFVKKGVNRND
jgi:hypothetical protein